MLIHGSVRTLRLRGQPGVVAVLLLTEDLKLEEELLLLEDLGVGGVQIEKRPGISLLVRRNVLMVLQLLYLEGNPFIQRHEILPPKP